MTQPTGFRFSTAQLDPTSECARNQKGTPIRVMRIKGKSSTTLISFQKVRNRWVPFKRQTVSLN